MPLDACSIEVGFARPAGQTMGSEPAPSNRNPKGRSVLMVTVPVAASELTVYGMGTVRLTHAERVFGSLM